MTKYHNEITLRPPKATYYITNCQIIVYPFYQINIHEYQAITSPINILTCICQFLMQIPGPFRLVYKTGTLDKLILAA